MRVETAIRSPGRKNFAGEDCQLRQGASALKLHNSKLVAAVALAALTTPFAGARADDIAAEIRELKEQVKQLEPLKARLKQLEAEVAKERRERMEAQQGRVRDAKRQPEHPEAKIEEVRKPDESQGQVSNAAALPVGPEMPDCAANSSVVSLQRGLTRISTDGDFSFHVGGRLMVDGGVSSFPAPAIAGNKVLPAVAESGFSNQVGIRYACLQVLGSGYRIWDYKFQYDFTGSPNGLVIGGLRDAYLMLRYPDPFSFQVRNFYEPFSLERTPAATTLMVDSAHPPAVTSGVFK